MLLRPARRDDDAALSRIDAATHSSLSSPNDERAPSPPFFGPDDRPEDLLVAELDGAVVGWVRLHQEVPLRSHAHVLTVNGLAVDPAAQGRGVGRALLDGVVAAAAERGARKVALRVLAGNAAARRLYEAAGFAVEGVLRGEFLLDGELVDDLLMARWVGDGA